MMKLCPKCRKAIHVSEITWYSNCPFCSFELGEYLDRRINARHRGRYHGILTHADEKVSYRCHTLDVSSMGAQIVYEGRTPGKGSIMRLHIGDLKTDSMVEVVWSRQVSDSLLRVGLRFVQQT